MPARWRGRCQHIALALVAYVPLLFTHRGEVGADTKTYLYLDPGRLLAKAPYMWDSGTGLGTVTHQTLGYLFPMGPYYWLMQTLGFPDWVAQLIWLGTILFAAGAGVLFLMRAMGWRASEPLLARGMVVAAAVYLLSPYVLDYAARISVILLPWAALPWLIGMAMRAAREGGWKWPAWFAVVIALVGGVNATALLFAGIGPVLWLVYAMFVTKEIEVRRAMAAIGRIGALTLGVSFWWIAGLWAQGKYGIPILRYTRPTRRREGLERRAAAGPRLLVLLRRRQARPWIEPSTATQHLWLIGADTSSRSAAARRRRCAGSSGASSSCSSPRAR
jgi:arabinofuranan 3-O-arabinosyltransferase